MDHTKDPRLIPMTKLIVFDLYDTLAESKSALDAEMAKPPEETRP